MSKISIGLLIISLAFVVFKFLFSATTLLFMSVIEIIPNGKFSLLTTKICRKDISRSFFATSITESFSSQMNGSIKTQFLRVFVVIFSIYHSPLYNLVSHGFYFFLFRIFGIIRN